MKQQVVICWVEKYSPTNVKFLSYGSGQVRVFHKDDYDLRLRRNLPFFDNEMMAYGHMIKNFGTDGVCQVAVEVAIKSFGVAHKDLAEVA